MKMRRYGVRPITRSAAITEGDLVNISADDDVVLLLKVQRAKGGSDSNKAEFIQYVDEKYGVSPNRGSGFIETIKLLCASVAGLGIGAGLASTISSVVTYARTLLAKLAGKPLTQEIQAWWNKKDVVISNIKMDKYTQLFGKDKLKNLLTGNPDAFNINMILTILVSALLTFVLYKIYKALAKTIVSASENANAIKKYRELEVKKAVLEANVLFSKSNNLLESDVSSSQGSASSLVLKIIDEATVLCGDLLTAFAKTGAYMMKTYPRFTAAVLICAGYVLSF